MIKQIRIETPPALIADPVAKRIVITRTDGTVEEFANYQIGHAGFIRSLVQDLKQDDMPCVYELVGPPVEKKTKKAKKTGLPTK